MHENPKVVEGHHEFVHPATVKSGEPSGYVEKEYEHQEYPKYVDGNLVKDAEAEKALLAAKQAAADEQGEDPEAAEPEVKKPEEAKA